MKHRRGNLGFLPGADENKERKTRLAAIEARIDCLVRAKIGRWRSQGVQGKPTTVSWRAGCPFVVFARPRLQPPRRGILPTYQGRCQFRGIEGRDSVRAEGPTESEIHRP